MPESQKFRAADAEKSNDAVSKIRAVIDGLPIAVAASAIDVVRDDVHRQLQYGHGGFNAGNSGSVPPATAPPEK